MEIHSFRLLMTAADSLRSATTAREWTSFSERSKTLYRSSDPLGRPNLRHYSFLVLLSHFFSSSHPFSHIFFIFCKCHLCHVGTFLLLLRPSASLKVFNFFVYHYTASSHSFLLLFFFFLLPDLSSSLRSHSRLPTIFLSLVNATITMRVLMRILIAPNELHFLQHGENPTFGLAPIPNRHRPFLLAFLPSCLLPLHIFGLHGIPSSMRHFTEYRSCGLHPFSRRPKSSAKT